MRPIPSFVAVVLVSALAACAHAPDAAPAAPDYITFDAGDFLDGE